MKNTIQYSLLSFALALSTATMAKDGAAPAKLKAAVTQSEQQLTKVSVNSASAAALADGLNGIGVVKAQAIIAYREEYGPFKSLDELVKVKGIGTITLEKNRQLLSL